jgi:hypothetical protein
MLKKALALGFLLLALSGCSPKPDQPAPAVPPQSVSVPDSPVAYSSGFFEPEQAAGLTWRWMGAEGVIKLRNTHRDMVLTIKGHAPAEVPQAAIIKVTLNGESLDQFSAKADEAEKQYTVSATQQANGDWSELRLTASHSYVPHEADPKSGDQRRLAFSLSALTWRPK